jgi:DNA-binding SARP family transcriptional activator
MSRLTIHILGSPEIRLDDQPLALRERKALALLVYLVVTNELHQREPLATLFWPEHSSKQGRSYLRRVLWGLRQTLGDGWLDTDGDDIQLSQTADIWVDVIEFKRLMAQNGPSSTPSSPPEQLEQAVALYRGDFLAGFTLPDSPAFDEWQFFEAETLRQTMISALDDLVLQYTQAIKYEAAIGHVRRRLSLDPLHEPAHQTLMRLYALSGRQAAALRQFDESRRILQDELGLDPDAETQALAAAIREKRFPPAK